MIWGTLLVTWLASGAPEPSLDRCDSVRREDPEHWRGYTCIYVYARKTGDYDGALQRARSLVAAEPERTWARYILADLLLDAGKPGAPALYDEVSREFAARGDFESAALSRVAYAFSFDAVGHEAIEAELATAVALAERADDPQLVAQVRLQQVRLMLRHGGPLGQAEKLLAEARDATFPEGPYEQRKFVLLLEAELAESLDQPQRSLERLADLEALAREQGDQFVSSWVATRVLALQVENPDLRREPSEALATRLAAIEGSSLQGNPHAEALYACLQGDLASTPEAAQEPYARCRSLATEIGATDSQRSALHGLALRWGDETLLEEARGLGRSLGGTGLFSQHLVARLRFRRGDWRGGIAAATEVFDAIERIGARQGATMGRARSLAGHAAHYDEVASWTVGPGPNYERPRIEAALQVVERLRARTMADALARAEVDVPTIDTEEHRALGRRIAAVNTALQDADVSEARTAELLEELTGLEREEAAAFDAWADGAEWSSAFEPLTLASLQDALAPDQALLSFQIPRTPVATRWESLPERAWIAVITVDDVVVHPLPGHARIEPLVRLLTGAIDDPENRTSLAAGLYARLLERVIDALPAEVDRLVLIPDRELHRLPFAVLGLADGPTLGERFELSRAPSLAIWRELRAAPARTQTAALALVAPEVDDPRLEVLATAEREGEALAAVSETIVRRGADASEAFVQDIDLRAFSVVHFGTHATLDEAHPERAAIVLAPGSPEHDGLLQPRELASASFGGGLVVLAACRGAAGPLVADEGPMGLAHAVFRGGARTVVASLWPLRDADASTFFARFYAALGEGSSVAEAVSRVQRQLGAEGRPPSAWAGVVVLGDGDLVPLASRPTLWRRVPTLLGWSIVLGFAGLLLRRRRAIA